MKPLFNYIPKNYFKRKFSVEILLTGNPDHEDRSVNEFPMRDDFPILYFEKPDRVNNFIRMFRFCFQLYRSGMDSGIKQNIIFNYNKFNDNGLMTNPVIKLPQV